MRNLHDKLKLDFRIKDSKSKITSLCNQKIEERHQVYIERHYWHPTELKV
jgi:hypothetical protein